MWMANRHSVAIQVLILVVLAQCTLGFISSGFISTTGWSGGSTGGWTGSSTTTGSSSSSTSRGSSIDSDAWKVLNGIASDLGFKWGSSGSAACGVYGNNNGQALQSYIQCSDDKRSIIGLTFQAAPSGSSNGCPGLKNNGKYILDGDSWKEFPSLQRLTFVDVDFSSTVEENIFDSSMPNLVRLHFSNTQYKCYNNFAAGKTFSKSIVDLYIENAIGTLPSFTSDNRIQYFGLFQGDKSALAYTLDTTIFTANLAVYNVYMYSTPTIKTTNLDGGKLFAGTKQLIDFQLFAPGLSTDFSTFYNLPKSIKTFKLARLQLINTVFPKITDVTWNNITTFALEGLGFTGTVDSQFFFVPGLATLSLRDNPLLEMSFPANIGTAGLVSTLILSNTSISGQMPTDIIDKQILTRLTLTNVPKMKGTKLPESFLCLPLSYFTGETVPAYLFDDSTFTNYQGASTPRNCVPSITAISPNPIPSNATFFTITGKNFGDKPNIQMSNGDDYYVVNSIPLGANSLMCNTPVFLQGAGFLTLAPKYSPNATSIAFSFASPMITSISSPSTLGGWVTLTGFDMLPYIGSQNPPQTYVKIGATTCSDISVIKPFEKMMCRVPAGTTSNVEVVMSIKGLSNDLSATPRFFYRAPAVQTSNAVTAGADTNITLTGSDFWNDVSIINVTVHLGANTSIACPVSYVNHSTVVCAFPATAFIPGTHNIQVTVAGLDSPANNLFSFYDEQICPNHCGGESAGVCNVGFGLCNCKRTAGPSCSEGSIDVVLTNNATLPGLNISATNQPTYLSAYLVSVYENGAETIIPSWKVSANGTYTWASGSRQINVFMTANNASSPPVQVGEGSNLNVFDKTFSYQVQYSSASAYTSLQFKFALEAYPRECATPPVVVGYPTMGSNTSAHWLTLTKFNTSWFARFPQVASVNGEGGSLSSTIINQDGLGMRVVSDISGASDAEPISSASFVFDFSALTSTVGRDLDVKSCLPTSTDKPVQPSSSDNKWKVTVGVVVGVVGAAVIAGASIYIFKQHRRLEQTKSLLDKKLSELNHNQL
ncbi:hypothetical protein SAMD00019534_114170 [Acytostelium subglobosum LB1]|uniref:hypothetical protein n=1 Tax=Acytostelium subglobosum LB1 TaxID=1410327 RepID=UPI000644BE0E|nr:hypothetical protein SAMD00019534_114170 [Acytostelium subglobosum LB1]GAM28241.1 hypothetical protein SAMD00019534_114170 [Acytostelium subglobosum LB1]|eukprot:XP_012748875.1 hypothetical protein SAMD00019534_114170 [Acytostelium subglobosum LB1]